VPRLSRRLRLNPQGGDGKLLEPEPQRFLTYEGRVKNGGILLSVLCDDSSWTKKAKEILERTEAKDVSSTGEATADFAKGDRPVSRKQMLWLSLGNRICKPVDVRELAEPEV
jgi:hypothetical protein